MSLRNIIGVETPWGFSSFELYHGDLTDTSFAADVLVVSAFRDNYNPVPGTLIGALHDKLSLGVGELIPACDFDLRSNFGFWVSQELQDFHFRRVMCLELRGGDLSVPEVIENIFLGVSVLDAKGVAVKSIALPMVGAGNQKIDPETVMTALLPAAKTALNRLPTLRTIRFVDISSDRVDALDRAMNHVLGRTKVTLPKSQLISSLKAEIVTLLDRSSHGVDEGHCRLFDEMRHVLAAEEARSFEVGLLGRRLAELVADDLLGSSRKALADKIQKLSQRRVASWIRGYLDTLRHLGNESAHEKSGDNRVPAHVSEEDLAVCLFCIQRILRFWVDHRDALRSV